MFRSSFIHIYGIGPKLEQALWREGICDWQTALDTPLERIAHAKTDWVKRGCETALRALERSDLAHFAQCWPSRDAWRWLPAFADRAVYLDIETNGEPKETGVITCIGLYDPALEKPRMLVQGRDLEQLPELLANYSLVVTYNGGPFDLPFIRAKFQGIRLPPLHVDLCPALRRVGLRGGLKSIERQVNLNRPDVVEEVDGWTAVLLWRRHLQGDDRALPTLLRYCAEDIVALEPLARIAFNRHLDLFASRPPHVAPMQPLARPRLNMPFSHELLGELTDVNLPRTAAVHETPASWPQMRPLTMKPALDQAVEWLRKKTAAQPNPTPEDKPPSVTP